jgi:hypothetical protein
MDDHEINDRLQAFEASVPVTGRAPEVRRPRVSRGRTALVAVAAVVVLAGGTAASGVLEAQASPGAFDPGQPLHCEGVAKMTPREAEKWLRNHGYDDVTWQVEDRTPGVPKGQQRSEQSRIAPEKGKIASAVFISRTELIVLVETGQGAIRADDCPRG